MDTTQLRAVPRKRRSDDPIELVLSSIRGFALVIDRKGAVKRIYAPSPAMLPGLKEAVVGQQFVESFPPPVWSALLKCLERTYDGRTSSTLEVDTPTVGLGNCLFELRFQPYRDDVLLVGRDISATQKMSRLVFEAVMDERRRISADLHDTLSSHLFGISLMANALAHDMNEDVPIAGHELSDIAALLSEGIDLVRNIAHGLVLREPSVVDLEATLQKIAGSLQRAGRIDCTFERIGELPSMNGRVTYHLEQIAQEAVRNSVKHGRASKISIKLELDAMNVILEVRDNGVGIEGSHPAQEGMGLNLMRHRSRMIGANLHVESELNQGTLVRATISLGTARKSPEIT